MSSPSGRRAAVYCRISEDKTGAGLAVERQEQDCRELAARLDWVVVEVFTDNDISAYSGKPRPRYFALLEAIRSGRVDAVIAWHTDRLHRSPLELETYIAVCSDGREVPTHTVQAGPLDLTTASGRMVARTLGAVARYESEQKGDRQRRERRQAAANGEQTAGGRRPYGYVLDRGGPGRITATVDPVEAAIINECVERVLSGEPVASVTRALNERGVLSSTGTRWNRTTLRRLLCSARISGRREHIPVATYRGKRGRPLVGAIVSDTSDWPAIITPDQSDRLRTLLSNPVRRLSSGNARMHLLSGLLRCGHCDHPLTSGGRRETTNRYMCNKDTGGCGGLTITATPTDDTITSAVFAILENPQFPALLTPKTQAGTADELLATIHTGESDLIALADRFAAGEIGHEVFFRCHDPIKKRVDEARKRLAQLAPVETHVLDDFAGTREDMCRRWDGLTLPQRHAIIRAVFTKVIVLPADRSGPRRPDPLTRLQPVLRGV